MSRALTLILVLTTGLSWLWVQPAWALKDQRDAKALFSALNDLMGFAAPGRSVTWENPETGNSGKVTVLQPGSVPGRTCWDYERTYEDNGTMAVRGTACEVETGLWETVSEGQPYALRQGAPAGAAAPAKPPSAAEIREAQSLLRRLQYDAGPSDGIYGRRTRHAVTAYQHDRGLAESGELTPETLSMLRQDVAALLPPAEKTGNAPSGGAPAAEAPADDPSGAAGEQELPWLKPEPEGSGAAAGSSSDVVVPPPPPPPE